MNVSKVDLDYFGESWEEENYTNWGEWMLLVVSTFNLCVSGLLVYVTTKKIKTKSSARIYLKYWTMAWAGLLLTGAIPHRIFILANYWSFGTPTWCILFQSSGAFHLASSSFIIATLANWFGLNFQERFHDFLERNVGRIVISILVLAVVSGILWFMECMSYFYFPFALRNGFKWLIVAYSSIAVIIICARIVKKLFKDPDFKSHLHLLMLNVDVFANSSTFLLSFTATTDPNWNRVLVLVVLSINFGAPSMISAALYLFNAEYKEAFLHLFTKKRTQAQPTT